MRPTRSLALVAALSTLTTLGGCTLLGDDGEESASPSSPTATSAGTSDAAGATGGSGATDDATSTTGDASDATGDAAGATTAPPAADPSTVVLVAHDSFALPDELVEKFEKRTGYDLEIQLSGDGGELASQLVLTAGRPTADVVFGIDNTFAYRVLDAQALEAYTPSRLPGSAEDHALEDGGADYLTPVDYGDVCVNVDDVWFAEKGQEPPQTLADLTKPEYKDLFVTPGATTSSPGLAFLLATVGEFGPQEWQGYWEDLMANGAKVTSGWTDAYTVDFTAGGGDGDRPIVLSYASSPPFTIPEDGTEPTTRALLDTCFRQTEYAGVLAGTSNPQAARAVVDWLVSREVQEAIPDSMYMFPVDEKAQLPEVWAQWAQVAEDPIVVHPQQIEAEREAWLREWADIATG